MEPSIIVDGDADEPPEALAAWTDAWDRYRRTVARGPEALQWVHSQRDAAALAAWERSCS